MPPTRFGRRRTGAPACQGRQGAGRQHRLDRDRGEKRFDGIFVLPTNSDPNPLEAMLCCKQLWTLEQIFRTAKHLFSSSTIFHKLDQTLRGQVLCNLLKGTGGPHRRARPLRSCGRRRAAPCARIQACSQQPKCSAKPPPPRLLLLPINDLANRSVEDEFTDSRRS
jgi:hypothetical protein